MTLVLSAGEDVQQVVQAEVVRRDKEADLALLKAKGERKYTPLVLGLDTELVETQTLIAFGYPFGTALKVKEKQYPSISVNVGRITALRRNKGQLEQIQTDAQVNPGNSGGPVITTDGKVVAIVRSGLLRTGVNFTIPVSKVTTFLSAPGIVFAPPAVDFENRYDEQELEFRVISFLERKEPFDVQLTLGAAPERTIQAEHIGADRYRIVAAPLPKPLSAVQLPVEITFDNGSIRGTMTDAKLKGVKHAARLADVRSAKQTDTGWSITNRDGDQQAHKSFGLKKADVQVGGVTVQVKWEHVQAITVYQPPREATKIPYVLSAAGKEVDSTAVQGKWELTNLPTAVVRGSRNKPPAGIYDPPEKNPDLGDEQVVFKLSHPYTQVVAGGSGQFFIFHLEAAKKVVIFDITQGKVVHEIVDVGDDVLLAAGRDKLVLVLPGDLLMQRWSLQTFEREQVARLPGKGTTYRALMGCNSNGPLLLGSDEATLVDIETMEPIVIEGKIAGGGKGMQVHVSANGQTFAGIPTGYGPVAFWRMQVNGKQTTVQSFSGTSNAIRWSWPTADGTLLTGSTGLFDQHLEGVQAKWLADTARYPTVDPRYFMAVQIVKDSKTGKPIAHAHICTTCDRNIVHTYVGFAEVAAKSNDWGSVPQHQINGHQIRFHYIPWANMLVSLPYGNQEIMLRRYDLIEQLHEADLEYLFIDSIPPHRAIAGESLSYQIVARSRASGLKYKLEVGPEGMTVSSDGLVTWNAPTNFGEDETQAIVAVSNSAGKEILHSFRLKVVEGVIVRKTN